MSKKGRKCSDDSLSKKNKKEELYLLLDLFFFKFSPDLEP